MHTSGEETKKWKWRWHTHKMFFPQTLHVLPHASTSRETLSLQPREHDVVTDSSAIILVPDEVRGPARSDVKIRIKDSTEEWKLLDQKKYFCFFEAH